jgi:hypothetical protein
MFNRKSNLNPRDTKECMFKGMGSSESGDEISLSAKIGTDLVVKEAWLGELSDLMYKMKDLKVRYESEKDPEVKHKVKVKFELVEANFENTVKNYKLVK